MPSPPPPPPPRPAGVNPAIAVFDPPPPSAPPPPPPPYRREKAKPLTRKKLSAWDRGKFLLLLVVLYWFFVWSAVSDNPLMTWRDAFAETNQAKRWLFVLFGVELVRQAHYLISERSARYHQFWVRTFGWWEARTLKVNDWNRYRIARVLKFALALVILAVVLGAVFDVPPATALFQLPARALSVLPMALQLLFAMAYVVIQFVAIFWFLSRGGVDVYFPDDIETRFDDVWGQDHVLERVKENMLFLDDPEAIEDKGGYIPGGILLWGPPGTGKTLMAEAVAGETGKPFVFVDPGAFNNMFMGVGILKVKGLFRKLRKLAVRYGGVIVFFDEADVLGNRGQMVAGGAAFGPPAGFGPMGEPEHLRWLSPRAQQALLEGFGPYADAAPGEPASRVKGFMMGMGGGSGTLQALLTELSGLKKPRGFINRYVRRLFGFKPKPPPKYRILVMMATNLPDALDPAMLRPGRIDRMYKVGYPSKEGRKRTYWGYLSKVSHQLTDDDVEKLAVITPYATGASIKDLVNEALITAIRHGREAITWPDVLRAKHMKSLGPPEDVEYIERERHAIAIHEACHAVAFYRTTKKLTIDLATIEKGGSYLGMVAPIPIEDQFSDWRSDHEGDIVVSLASLAGERYFFEDDNSSGVSGDLRQATTVATLMEAFWGMGETISSFWVREELRLLLSRGRPKGGKDDAPATPDLTGGPIGERIEQRLRELYDRAWRLVDENRLEVLSVAHALEKYKTLSGEDVIAIIEGTQGPVVDGRVYHTVEFIRAAEQYHLVALAAHQQQSKVDALLPELPPMAQLTPATKVGPNGHGGADWFNGYLGWIEGGEAAGAHARPPAS